MPHYRISALPLRHLFRVELTFSHQGNQAPKLSLPNWVPGSYMIREFARHLTDLSASCNGQTVPLQQLDKHTWQAAANCHGEWQLVYHIYAFDLSVRGCYLDSERGFFDGAALFLRLHGSEQQTHRVRLDFPAEWQTATSLPRLDDGTYHAPNYRQLIDHPVEAGCLEILVFTSRGLPHRIVLSGRYADFDRDRLLRDTLAICETQLDFFPAPAPFADYTFLLHVGDKLYGGLEHGSATALLADRRCLPAHGLGEPDDGYTQLLGLISHEYFHAWNVKSIQPAAFAESELDREAYTEQLWAFEGITSYYDDLFLVRSGVLSPAGYLKLLAQNLTRVQQGHGRRLQSLAQSSFTAWDKYYKPNENSPNAIVSYYQKGALAALCLDLTVRQRSQGRHSLDSIMQALYQDWLDHRTPLPEGRWESFAQGLTGLDLQDFFDHAIRSTAELPLADSLALGGVRLSWLPLPRSHGGGTGDMPPPAAAVPDFGARFKQNAADITLSHVFSHSSAEQAGLAAGDRLIALNGYAAADFAALWAQQPVGSRVSAHYFRHGVLRQTEIDVQAAQADTAWLSVADADALARWLQMPDAVQAA